MRTLISIATIAAIAPLSAHAGGPAIELQGRGVQIYICARTPAGFAWRLTGPEADLFDAYGHKAGHHFAGPSWQANDGSTVTGEIIASSVAPDLSAIPWLLLRAKSHTGTGVFDPVQYIARIRTRGGLAPHQACDAAHAGARQKIGYSATYILFSG